jgi:hypothetical protein
MASRSSLHSGQPARGSRPEDAHARGGRRDLLSSPKWMPLADASARFPSLADRLRVFPPMAAGRHVGANRKRQSAAPDASRSSPEGRPRGRCRQAAAGAGLFWPTSLVPGFRCGSWVAGVESPAAGNQPPDAHEPARSRRLAPAAFFRNLRRLNFLLTPASPMPTRRSKRPWTCPVALPRENRPILSKHQKILKRIFPAFGPAGASTPGLTPATRISSFRLDLRKPRRFAHEDRRLHRRSVDGRGGENAGARGPRAFLP